MADRALAGVSADIYRSGRPDCSNGGLSSRVSSVVVVGTISTDPDGGTVWTPLVGPTAPDADRPAVVLVKSAGLHGRVNVHAQPYEGDAKPTWWMAGGTFIATSDSRFHEATGIYGAVALHDRTES